MILTESMAFKELRRVCEESWEEWFIAASKTNRNLLSLKSILALKLATRTSIHDGPLQRGDTVS